MIHLSITLKACSSLDSQNHLQNRPLRSFLVLIFTPDFFKTSPWSQYCPLWETMLCLNNKTQIFEKFWKPALQYNFFLLNPIKRESDTKCYLLLIWETTLWIQVLLTNWLQALPRMFYNLMFDRCKGDSFLNILFIVLLSWKYWKLYFKT